ncbi:DUF4974 domain-containing protein [Olivibacter sp. SDN3]|uniref:FecR family protein n=1 Tax=Olivibacter sp. SDN3 TaxID=2764720 RepID=UPI0016519DDA|nr:FecR domain-containing protein [Olivibacter sp. SDN3]QNL50469.1 DUF4974 domain-containing protein [Olivibacter sp. SDN3]
MSRRVSLTIMNDRLRYLYKRYCENRCTTAEREEFLALLQLGKGDENLHSLLDETWNAQHDDQSEVLTGQQLEHVVQRIMDEPQPKRPFWRRWHLGLAATIVGVIIGCYFLHLSQESPIENEQTLVQVDDVLPGDNRAVLVLEDGRKVDLEQAIIGELTQIDGIKAHKTEEGLIVFSAGEHEDISALKRPRQNTITTPRGGEFKIKLPDGSIAFLNASSSLSFPSRFSPDERRVELVGEAYFEVANKRKGGQLHPPFIVHTVHQEVKVLGTAFNVQAYPDQKANYTTLVNGAVKVSTYQSATDRSEQILKPGQQAIVESKGSSISIKKIDLEEVLAWKDGYFLFTNEPLRGIMEKVSRWYDVEVQYEGDVQDLRFFGIYARTKSLRSLLENIEQTKKIRFDILSNDSGKEERRIIVKAYRK